MTRTWSIPAVSAVALAAACAGGGMSGGSAPRAAAPSLPLAVMSFNIRYGTAADGPDAWAERRGLLFDVIREASPDVLGLQEALRGQLDELHAALPGYGEGGVGRDDGRTAGEYAAILFRNALPKDVAIDYGVTGPNLRATTTATRNVTTRADASPAKMDPPLITSRRGNPVA